MDSKEPNKCLYTEKKKVAAQLRRRDTYSQISSNRREELLLARRMRSQDSVNHACLPNSTVVVPEQPTSSSYRATVRRQAALTIREPPLLLEKAVHAPPSVDTSANNKNKGKAICSPFVITEAGGTSNTFDQHLRTAQPSVHTSVNNKEKGKTICNPFRITEPANGEGQGECMN